MQDSLQEIVQLVGKESLSEDQKVVLDIAEMIVEDFLYQNAFTKYDYQCPLAKSVSHFFFFFFFFFLFSATCVVYILCYHSFLKYFKHVFIYICL